MRVVAWCRALPETLVLLKEQEEWTDPRSAVSGAGAVLCSCLWSACPHFFQKLSRVYRGGKRKSLYNMWHHTAYLAAYYFPVVRLVGSGGGYPKSAATDGYGDQEQLEL